jgi:predicted enzyme related to lactoylglutathione lyase
MIQSNSSFLILYTNNLEKTEEFYTKLGVEITEKDNRKLVFSLGSLNLHFNIDEPVKEYSALLNQKERGAGIIFGIEVEDIEKQYRKLQQMNVEIFSPIITAPWETREFMVNDPNGYHIVFWQEI